MKEIYYKRTRSTDANENYAANFGEKKDLGLPPAKFAILAWMRVLIQQNMQVCQRVMPCDEMGGRV
jgi:hypothetical protein